MSNWRKGYVIQQTLPLLKPQVGVKMTPYSRSFQITFVGRAGNAKKVKLIEAEELDHARIKVSLHNLSLVFTVGYKIVFPLRFCLTEYTWWTM